MIKDNREDSSAQQGRLWRGCVKFCESGCRSGTQNLGEGLAGLCSFFPWAFCPFSFSPFASQEQISSEHNWSVMRLHFSSAMPAPNPRLLLYIHRKEDEMAATTENYACMGTSPWGKSNCLLLVLRNPTVQSINTCQIRSSLPAVFIC